MKRYPITPVSAPRQNWRTKWSKKDGPRLARYHAFRDECRLRHVEVTGDCYLRFEMPVAKSMSGKKHSQMLGQPHTQRPDLDNLVKALLDAVLIEDRHIWRICAEKVWAQEGAIVVGIFAEAVQEGTA